MAVLYRTNALSRAFEGALMRAKIPYEIAGDVGFYARAEIKIALAYLRLDQDVLLAAQLARAERDRAGTRSAGEQSALS